MSESTDIDVRQIVESNESKMGIVQWCILGLLTAVLGLAGLNARSYVEGIASEVYAAQGLRPSQVKEQLKGIEVKLSNVEGNVTEVRADIRALMQAL